MESISGSVRSAQSQRRMLSGGGSLEVPVNVKEEVGAAGGHVALHGDLAPGAQGDDGVVGPNDPGTEIDGAGQRSGPSGGIEAEIAVVGRPDDGQVDRYGHSRGRDPAKARDREGPDRVCGKSRAARGAGRVPRV